MSAAAERTGLRGRLRFLLSMAMVTATAVVISPFSSTPVATAAGPVSEDFSNGYATNSGSGWPSGSAWDESGDNDSPNSGTMSIVSGALEFDNLDSDSISRDLDLTGFAPGATFSFELVDEQAEGSSESLVFEFNPDGPVGWQTIASTPNSPDGTRLSYVLPSAVLTDGVFRIRGGDTGWQGGDEITIDDLLFADYVANPDLDASCGIDVEIILDESGSIDSEGAIPEVEGAVRAFAQGLAGTTSSLRFMEFSTTGRDATIGGSNALQEVDAALLGDIDAYLNGTGPTGDVTTYSPGDNTSDNLNFTNWEAGLDRAQPNNADLVVFITDGVPNTVGTVSPSNNNGGGSDASAAAAFEEAAAVRAAGTKLLGVGVGQVTNTGNLERLEELVEPNGAQTWEGTGTLDISTVDVIAVENFEDLDDALRQVVFALCSPSVSITKVDQNGDAVAGLDFTGTVNIAETGEAIDEFEWVSPVTGLASSVGVTQTDTTTGSGSTLFQWVPGTVADPEPWASTFTFTESLTGDFAGWTLPAQQDDCSVDRLLSTPAPDGSISETIEVELIASGPDGNGLVTFSLQENGQTFEIGKGDIVRCEVQNLEPATITIAKAVDNDGTDNDTFGFTGDLGAFDLDDTGTDTETFTVAPGTYTVTESDPTSLSYELTGIACGNVTGTAGGTADLANRSVEIDVEAGAAITCTFTNTEVPAADLQITKNPSPDTFPEQDGSVTYTVTITNPNGADNPIDITAITDSATLNGGSAVGVNLLGAFPQPYPGGSVTASTCPALSGTTVGEASVDCEFTVAFTDRNAGDDIDDTVTVAGTDTLGNPIQRTASAEVDVTPVPPSILVDKQNKAGESIVAPGGTATYTVTVTNNGTVEDVTLTGVTDVVTVGGSTIATPDLTSNAAPLVSNTCTDLVGTVLAPTESYSCEFAITVSGLAQGDVLLNTVTVTGEDDDPTPQTTEDDDPAERTVLGEPPAITVFKTDNDETIAEPGESIVYDIDITNESTTEAVTITEITDEVYITPDGGSRALAGTVTITSGSVSFVEANASGVTLVGTTCDADDADGGIGSVLAISGDAGDSTSCSITLNLPGNAGDDYDDKVVVKGVDETQDPVEAENTAETPVVDVEPTIVVDKSANPTSVPEYGPEAARTVTFTVVVANDSVSTDPLTITSLEDSDFGDLFDAGNTAVTSNTCGALQGTVLAPGASSAPCTFTAVLSGTVATPHQNTVTVQGTDDEGNTAVDDDDAEVDFTNVDPTIDVTKTAIDPVSKTVPEFGDDVIYEVTVTNTSGEPVTITSLADDKFGNLDGQNDCAIGTELAPTETYTCTFTGFVAQDQVNTPPTSTNHVNVVTAKAVDDEGTEVTDFDDETITFTPEPPQIEVTKTDDDATVPEPGGPVEYDITITNPADALENIVDITTLTDQVTIVEPAAILTYDLLGATPDGRLTASDCATQINAALPLVPGESVSCTFTLDLSDLTAQSVSDIVTVVGVDNDGQSDDDTDTEETPITDVAPAVQIVKTANPIVIDAGASTTYSFEITNLSSIEPLFIVDLDDDMFGSLNGLDASCGFSVETPVELAPNGEAGDSITCVIELTPDFVNDGVDGVHTNVATVTAADDEILKSLDGEDPMDFVTDDDDAQVYASADIVFDKVVNDDDTSFVDGVWTIAYDIAVENIGLSPADYDIVDELNFGDGVTVTSTQATGPVTVNTDFDPDPDSPSFDNELVSDVELAAGVTHTYRVTVTATVADAPAGAGACNPDGTTAGGFLNIATVSVNDEAQPPVSDCEPFSTLTLNKVLVNDNGGNAGYDAFSMTATPSQGGAAILDGTTSVTGAIPAGDYDLAEPALAGYSSSGWTCSTGEDAVTVENGTATTGSISIAEGDDVTCEITNDDDPVDLELTKSDGGATAVAGGDPFPYTITIENVGTRAVDTVEDVVVVDALPSGFEWVSFPDDALELPVCAVDGTDPSVLRCDVDPADLGVGEQVVIQTTVRALPDTPGGTYTNVAWVTTDDDPVCDPQAQDCDPTCEESCTPPPCPDGDVPGSNVGCDDTPVVHEGELEIVKVDDVDFTVINGDTFSYDLSVSNTGPSPITDVVVTDDLPDGLSLESVSANPAHWTCNDTDPISCTYNTPLAAGPAASSITVTVTVDDDATFADDTIVNVAVANGDLDDEPLPPVDDDEETPLERTLDVKLLTTDCLNDAPFINYEIDAVGFVPTGDVTFRLYDADDNLVDTIVQSGLSGRFVYPGAAVDGAGNGIDWPGWKLEDGVWVLDDSDAILRDGLRVEVEVNPSVTTSVEYPPASSACADPTQTSADLSIEKTASVAIVAVGDGTGAETFDWTLDVANAGPDPAVDVVVQDIIPSVLTVTGVSSDYFDCSTSGQTVTCTRGTMPVGGAGSITISVSLPDSAIAGPIENVGTVESNVPDPDLSNNSDDAAVDVVSQEPPVTQAPPPVTLPPTGSNGTSPMIQIGLLLLAVGAIGVVGARRRRGIAG